MDELDLGATIRGFSAGQRIFKRYTLQRQLGRGGMGVVWLARDEELGRDTALKFLPEVVATDRAAIADMKREVRRAIDLAHPHIVKIHDFVTDGHMAAVSMEYVAGDTLSALRVDQPDQLFSADKLAPWVAQLCSALDYAHGTGEVVHRDLKPVNLMVNQRGDLKVLDFGIAASLSESVTRVSKQAGSSGTPVYMSPQQMMGGDPAVTDDVYALGATLYELFTGKPPFFAGNILAQVQSKVPALVNERRKVTNAEAEPVPAAWEETIAACLAKEPQDRPQSFGEVAERLGVGPALPAARPLSGGMATKSTKNAKAESPTPSSKTQNPKSKAPLIAGLVVAVIALAGLGWYFGVHAPEQRRLDEEKRLVEAEQAKAAAVEKKRQEAEVAREKSESEQVLVRIAAMTDDASAEQRKLTGEAVDQYVRNWPPAVHAAVRQQWQTRLTAWDAAQQRRAQEEAAQIARAAAAREKSELERISARIAAMADSATAEERKAVENAVNEYGQAWPVLFNREVRPAWQTRLAAWETAQQRRVAQEEAARVSREAAAHETARQRDQRAIALARDAVAFVKIRVSAAEAQNNALKRGGLFIAGLHQDGMRGDTLYPEWQKLNDRAVALMKEFGETDSSDIKLVRQAMPLADRVMSILLVRQGSSILNDRQNLPEGLQREIAASEVTVPGTRGVPVDRWTDLARELKELELRLSLAVENSRLLPVSELSDKAQELLPGIRVLQAELRQARNPEDIVSGLQVIEVAANAPLGQAFPVGTIFENINGVTATDFTSAKKALKSGLNRVTYHYLGSRRTSTVNVAKLAQSEASGMSAEAIPSRNVAAELAHPASALLELLPGVSVVPLTAELRQSNKLDDRITGLLITNIGETSPYKGNLPVGAVLEQINRVPVTDFNSGKAALKQGRNITLVYYKGSYRYVTFDHP